MQNERKESMKYYESDDLFISRRINFFQKVGRLCGVFIGYVDIENDEYHAFPVGRTPHTFSNMDGAKYYINGKFDLPVIPEPEEIPVYRKHEPDPQLTLF